PMQPAALLLHHLSLHDALPICPRSLALFPTFFCAESHPRGEGLIPPLALRCASPRMPSPAPALSIMSTPPDPLDPLFERWRADRSEEHTSELQSRENLVCRLLL